MKVELAERVGWVLPQLCCKCGDVTNAAPTFEAQCLVAVNVEDIGTTRTTTNTFLKLKFPVCEPCRAARASSSRSMWLGAGLGAGAGIAVAVPLLNAFGETPAFQSYGVCLTLLLPLITLVIGTAVASVIWAGKADPDARRRAGLPAAPVTMSNKAPVHSTGFTEAAALSGTSMIDFEFTNDVFGEAFARANGSPVYY